MNSDMCIHSHNHYPDKTYFYSVQKLNHIESIKIY